MRLTFGPVIPARRERPHTIQFNKMSGGLPKGTPSLRNKRAVTPQRGHITGNDFKSIAECSGPEAPSIDSNSEIATTQRGNNLKTFFETLFGKQN